MIIIVGGRDDNLSSNPGLVCISHSANTLGKGMNPTILHQAMSKIVGQTGLFYDGMAIEIEGKP